MLTIIKKFINLVSSERSCIFPQVKIDRLRNISILVDNIEIITSLIYIFITINSLKREGECYRIA